MMLASRLRQILVVFALANLAIVAHLVRLQVVDRGVWVAKGEEQRSRRILREPIRGPIRFADGSVAAETENRYDLQLRPTRLRTVWPIGALAVVVRGLERGEGFWWTVPADSTARAAAIAEEASRLAAVLRYVAGRPELALRALLERPVDAVIDRATCPLDPSFGDAFAAVFGRRTYGRLVVGAREGAATVGEALALERERLSAILDRLDDERRSFRAVVRALGVPATDLVERLARNVLAAENNARARLVREGIDHRIPSFDGVSRETRRRYREIIADYRMRERVAFRGVPFEAVVEVDRATGRGRLAGFELTRYLSRLYPNDLIPQLIGNAGTVTERDAPDPTADALEGRVINAARVGRLQAELLDRSPFGEAERTEVRALEDAILEKAHLADRNVGQAGLEFAYDRRLRGVRGSERLVHLPGAERSYSVHRVEPVDGEPLDLTIDSRLQRYGAMLLARDRASRVGDEQWAGRAGGALVALEPHTGRILALVTDPTYTRDDLRTRLDELRADPAQPFRNRALECNLPGSVFKPFTALWGLECGVLDPAKALSCWARNRRGALPRCSAHSVPTDVALTPALGDSCNAYFSIVGASAAAKTGHESMRALFRRFELDRPPLATNTGRAHCGVLGDWEKSLGRYVFRRRNIAQVSIGQGPVAVSPLHVASLYAIIANRGFHRPAYLTEASPRFSREPTRVVASEHVEPLIPGLISTMTTGTADKPMVRKLRDALGGAFEIAGKTGSATYAGRRRPKHSWFAGFAPVADPTIVVVVFLQNRGLGGGDGAAQVAAAFLSKYFALQGLVPSALVASDG